MSSGQLNDALKQEGFVRVRDYQKIEICEEFRPLFETSVNVHNRQIRLFTYTEGLKIGCLPFFYIDLETSDVSFIPFETPHIERHGGVCYANSELVLDPTNLAGSLLLCYELAIKTIENILTGKASSDPEREFFAYWS